jgi:hypothetical protein
MKTKPTFPSESDQGLTRRQFLGIGGLGSLGLAIPGLGAENDRVVQGVRYNDPLQPLIFSVDRAWDLMRLDIELVNFMPVRQRGQVKGKDGRPQFHDEFSLHIASYAKAGYVVLHFGGQHIAEQAVWDRPVVGGAEGKSDKGQKQRSPTYFLEQGGHEQSDDIKFLRSGRFVKDDDGKDVLMPGMLGGLAGAWIAGSSQVVFEVPQRYAPLPFDVDAILDLCLSRCPLRVHPLLLETEPPKKFFMGSAEDQFRLERPYLGHHDTGAPYTNIEFPSMLYISPYDNARWHVRKKSWGNRSELWSLDLQRPDPGEMMGGRPRALRRQGHLFAMDTEVGKARWPLEGKPDSIDDKEFKYTDSERPKTSLYQATRQLLVGQMCEDNGDILAKEFRLTALGASAHLEYRPMVKPRLKKETSKTPSQAADAKAPVADGVTTEVVFDEEQKQRPGFLTEWVQKTELGRDYYVKEAFAGWWFPFQLPAESVTITERQFCAVDSGEVDDPLLERVANAERNTVALLVARKFGVVKERVREFGSAESDDFDSAGAKIARSMGLRKIEILVDRTPTLSNQPTQDGDLDPADETKFAVMQNRLSSGEDLIYVGGGTGKQAGTEIFWPRVAVNDSQPESPKRNLTAYRFPVEMTFIDGTVRQTHMPMLFCYDLVMGGNLYDSAPDVLKSVPVNSKVTLAPAQPAGAINPADLSVEDGKTLNELLQTLEKAHGTEALGLDQKRLEEIESSDSAATGLEQEDIRKLGEAVGGMRNDTLARMTSVLLGGVREQMLDHVAKFKDSIFEWVRDMDNQPGAILRDRLNPLLNDEVIRTVLGLGAGAVDKDERNLFLKRVFAAVGWGREAYRGVDAARAAQRLGDVVELIRGSDDDKTTLVTAFLDQFKNRAAQLVEARSVAISKLNKTLEKVTSLETLEKQLPSLQAQWVAELGLQWQRNEWDEWFAELIVKVRPDGWIDVMTGMLQKAYANAVMKPSASLKALLERGKTLPWRTEKDLEFFKPIRGLASEGPLAGGEGGALPALNKAVAQALENIRKGVEKDGVAALLRLREAVESALPGELMLRQRAQHLVEDFGAYVQEGQKGAMKIKHELEGILNEAGTQISNITAFVDGGVQTARNFVEGAAQRIEHAAEDLAALETKARQWVDAQSKKFKTLPEEQAEKLKDSQTGKFVMNLLESNPAQSFNQLKNLLHESGGRQMVEVEEQLMGLADVVRSTAEKMREFENEGRKYAAAVSDGNHAAIARIRLVLLKHREMRERLLEEVSNTVRPYRTMLRKLLGAAAKNDKLPEAVKVAYERMMDTVGVVVPVRLAARVSELLAQLRPAQALTSPLQELLAKTEAEIEVELAKFETVPKDKVFNGLKVLKKYGSQFNEEFNQEIKNLDNAIQADLKAVEARVDDVEQVVVALLDRKKEEVKAVLQQILGELLSTGDGGVGDIQKRLEDAWVEITPRLEKIQAKVGQSFAKLENAKAKIEGAFKGEELFNDLEDKTQKLLRDVEFALENRRKYLEGAGLNLVHKAKLALHCPSLVKSFRDQSAKASYHVEDFVFKVTGTRNDLFNEVAALKNDFRTAVGFPGLAKMKVRIPNLDVAQVINHTKDYVDKGLRGLKKEAAGVFAELAKGVSSAAQDSGMADAMASVQMLSRDLGGVAKKAQAQVKALEGAAREFGDKVADLKKAKDNLLNAPAAAVEEMKGVLNEKKAELLGLKERLKDDLAVEAANFLPDGASKLFGVLPMKDILAVIGSPDKAPQILANRLPDRVEKKFVWQNEVRELDMAGIVKFEPVEMDGVPAKLRIENTATVWVPKPGQPQRSPEFFTRGHLDAFSLSIAGMLKIHFRSVGFTGRNGKFDFNPALGRVKGAKAGGGGTAPGGDGDTSSFLSFMGPLEVVDSIRKTMMSFISGKNGPLITIEDNRIQAGYAISLPALTFGVVTIANISLSVQLSLPLKSGPLAFLFKLCDRFEPFRVAVWAFTGGGYLGVQVSPDRRLCYVEGSLEFGGSLSLNFAIAEGELYLMAGIYFRMEQAGVTLSGYLRAGGRVTILGLIEVAIMFYLALFYRKLSGGKTEFWGQCTVSVRIKIGFFKKTVQVSMEKRFAGSESKSQEDEQQGTVALGRSYVGSERLLAQVGPWGSLGPAPSPARSQYESDYASANDWANYWNAFAHVKAVPVVNDRTKSQKTVRDTAEV